MEPTMTHLAMHVQDIEACIAFYRRFCHMEVVHQRIKGAKKIVWLAERGREKEFIFVLMNGGEKRDQAEDDYSHLGFALGSPEEVDQIAQKAKGADCLVWEPRRDPYPVGYYCGLRDPDGNYVEFSYGQPLGPGADEVEDPATGEES